MKKRTKQIKWNVLIFCFFFVFFQSPQSFLKAEAAPQTETAKTSTADNPAQTVPSVKGEKTVQGKYYLDFKAASLINVLNVLSSLSGINFVAGRELTERQVNMTLENVGLEDVLQALVKGCNIIYDFYPEKNIYIFRAAADTPDKSALMTRVFKLYYVQVCQIKDIEVSGGSSSGSGGSSEGGGGGGGSSSGSGLVTLSSGSDEKVELEDSAIYKTVEKILSERGKVSVDDRSNSLIVTDSEDRLKMIETAIMQLDRPIDQVLINVILVETFEDLDRELGVSWGNPTTGAFGTVYGATENTNFPFVQTAGGNSRSFWTGFVKTWQESAKQFNPTVQTAAGPNATVKYSEGIRDFRDFQITVKAMENASKLKILAKPKILVLDNHPAVVKIATKTAIGTIETTASAGGSAGTSTSSAERSEIGTILRVTPLINTGNRITLTVEPTFATVDDSAITVGGFAAQDPTVRQARTTMMVNDGQSIALGGMLMSTQSNGNRKVPFFGNIPLIGKALFTSNSKSLQDRELILFVTPFIIRDPAVLETLNPPEQRMRFDDETAPFWKVKQKQWHKEIQKGTPPPVEFDQYFNVREKVMDSMLTTLDKHEQAAKG